VAVADAHYNDEDKGGYSCNGVPYNGIGEVLRQNIDPILHENVLLSVEIERAGCTVSFSS